PDRRRPQRQRLLADAAQRQRRLRCARARDDGLGRRPAAAAAAAAVSRHSRLERVSHVPRLRAEVRMKALTALVVALGLALAARPARAQEPPPPNESVLGELQITGST